MRPPGLPPVCRGFGRVRNHADARADMYDRMGATHRPTAGILQCSHTQRTHPRPRRDSTVISVSVYSETEIAKVAST